MQDAFDAASVKLSGLSPAEWRAQLAEIGDDAGFYQDLGERHFATFLDRGKTLLVTFETRDGIRRVSSYERPLGFEVVKDLNWSLLSVVADTDTWFRENRVYGFFDRLIDDGFFEDFDRVVFYGARSCGYAACAFSVAAPGATVFALQPQATLDPRMSEWDDRFLDMRRTSFTDRYGYAPDMLDAAQKAYVFYDPTEQLDAMHAALFRRSNVSRLRLPNMGSHLETALWRMQIVQRMLTMACRGRFSEERFFRQYRLRRDHLPYLRRLMEHLELTDRPGLSRLLCTNVVGRMNAPRFQRRLAALDEAGV